MNIHYTEKNVYTVHISIVNVIYVVYYYCSVIVVVVQSDGQLQHISKSKKNIQDSRRSLIVVYLVPIQTSTIIILFIEYLNYRGTERSSFTFFPYYLISG